MAFTRDERETVIRFDAARAWISIWTADPVVVRKLAKRGVQPRETGTLDGVPSSWRYRVPYGTLRWGVIPKTGGQGGVAGRFVAKKAPRPAELG